MVSIKINLPVLRPDRFALSCSLYGDGLTDIAAPDDNSRAAFVLSSDDANRQSFPKTVFADYTRRREVSNVSFTSQRSTEDTKYEETGSASDKNSLRYFYRPVQCREGLRAAATEICIANTEHKAECR